MLPSVSKGAFYHIAGFESCNRQRKGEDEGTSLTSCAETTTQIGDNVTLSLQNIENLSFSMNCFTVYMVIIFLI